MDYTDDGILQARILEWVAVPFFRGSSRPGERTRSPALRADSLPSEPPEKPLAVILICISLKISDIEHLFMYLAFLIAQLVKSLPAMQKTQVQSLGWKDLMEKGKATHSSILAWRIPWTI